MSHLDHCMPDYVMGINILQDMRTPWWRDTMPAVWADHSKGTQETEACSCFLRKTNYIRQHTLAVTVSRSNWLASVMGRLMGWVARLMDRLSSSTGVDFDSLSCKAEPPLTWFSLSNTDLTGCLLGEVSCSSRGIGNHW